MKLKRTICIMVAVFVAVTFSGCKTAQVPNGFTRGTINDAVYTNDYTGITFTLPNEEWVYSDDSDIEFVLELDEGALSGTEEELAALYAKTPDLIGMYAHHYNTGTAVMYILDNLGVSKYGNTSTDAAGYLKNIIKDRNSSSDTTYEFGDIGDFSIAGYDGAMVEAYLPQYEGVQRYIAFKLNDIMNFIIITTSDSDYIDIVVNSFARQ